MTVGVWLWLWLGLAANVAAYFWLGRNVVAQPRSAQPLAFMASPVLRLLAVIIPPIGFALIVIAGFAFTNSGWWYLAASVFAFVALSVRPQMF